MKTGCGLNSEITALDELDTRTKVIEGTDKQERMNDHEENEKDLRSADCHGYGTGYEHKCIRCYYHYQS